LRSNAKEALGTSAAFCGGTSYAGFHVSFCFQTIEGGIDGANRHFSPGACFDLLPNRNAIGLVTKTKKREKDDVFEFAEVIASRHYVYNMEEIARLSQERFLSAWADAFAGANAEEEIGPLRLK
jgi:hypothetical protein